MMHLVSRILTRLRPSLSNDGDVIGADYLTFLVSRGASKAARGAAVAAFCRGVRSPFFVGKGVTIRGRKNLVTGPGCHIGSHSLIDCLGTARVELGRNVTLREGTWLQCTSHFRSPGQGVRIGDGSYFGPNCVLGAGGRLEIGRLCQFGAGVTFATEEHVTDLDEIYGAGVTRQGITVEDDVWVGNGVHILDGVQIGKGSVVGAGSVVTRSLPPYSVAVGAPARVVRTRVPDEGS